MKIFKDNQRSAIFKRLILLLLAIVIIFAAINAVWYFGYQQRYNHLSECLDAKYIDDIEEKDMLRYFKDVDDYTITLKMPAYLGSGGFISVARTEGYVSQLDDNGNVIAGSEMYITLYIWPKYFSDYKLGLDFYDEVNSVWEQVELTSDMELMNTDALDDEYIEYVNQLISEYDAEITKLIDIAERTLNIDIGEK